MQAACILRAFRVVATGRFALMGWADAEWDAARQAAEQHELALLEGGRAAAADPRGGAMAEPHSGAGRPGEQPQPAGDA